MDFVAEKFELTTSANSCDGRCGGGCQNSGSHRCNSGPEHDLNVRPSISAADLLAEMISSASRSPAKMLSPSTF